MFAKNLENLLFLLCEKSDVCCEAPSNFIQRFESLRGYGRLPRGRENRGKRLNNYEIASAILGLISVCPKWAGHGSIVLGKLRAAGSDAPFFEPSTLQESIAHILSNEIARTAVARLNVSLAESGINSHGYAILTYQADGVRRQRLYAAQAVLTAQSNIDELSEPRTFHAPAFRSVGFNRPFFERIAKEIKLAEAFHGEPEGDGSEYDAEEALAEKHKKLGVTPRSRFLNVGVDNQVTWPKTETLVKFDRYHLVLMPKTQQHVQSIHIDLVNNRLSDTEGMTIINRFLSVMTWCDDQFAVAQHGWSGNPIPVPVPKRDLAFTTASTWIFDRKLPSSPDGRRALALYREARNAEQNYMISYAVLNYYKIIEIRNHGKQAVKRWVRDNLPKISPSSPEKTALTQFTEICGTEKPHDYIYESCRIAVAHAGKYSKSDPDDVNELRRLHIAAEVMRILAREFIATELDISDLAYSGE